MKNILSCIVAIFVENAFPIKYHNISPKVTAMINKIINVQIPQGIFHFAEKYSQEPKTIASVGNKIPIGVAISRMIIIMTHMRPRVSKRCVT